MTRILKIIVGWFSFQSDDEKNIFSSVLLLAFTLQNNPKLTQMQPRTLSFLQRNVQYCRPATNWPIILQRLKFVDNGVLALAMISIPTWIRR